MSEQHHHYHNHNVTGQPSAGFSFGPDPLEQPSVLDDYDYNTLDGLFSAYEHRPQQTLPTALDDNFYLNADAASPSPPPPNFLDHILNPAGLDHNRFSPFVCYSTPRLPPPVFPHPTLAADDMSPNTRSRPQATQRPARLPNGYVDLTATPDSPPQRRRKESTTPGPSAKRQKRADGSAAKRDSTEPTKVEEVDLTDDRQSVQEILQKQREDAVKAQTTVEEQPTTFNTFTCVICMDTPTDLTATACGHLFCHTCLMEALIAGENRAGPGEAKKSQCPVCRKFINRSKASDIIPLLLKKGLATQPRKKAPAVAAGVAPKVQ